ncbi:hypothetical protein EYZ11_009257 [Aspergillus tanneri]|uniref:Uncharacterized protein n=1 Tax=Aspergillus tanneri TaxID=1220188 RepID=A0A4S3J8J2_9EURO|nr:hypothetical protein EYZ11_009257 [Aspergillus tanneri]
MSKIHVAPQAISQSIGETPMSKIQVPPQEISQSILQG